MYVHLMWVHMCVSTCEHICTYVCNPEANFSCHHSGATFVLSLLIFNGFLSLSKFPCICRLLIESGKLFHCMISEVVYLIILTSNLTFHRFILPFFVFTFFFTLYLCFLFLNLCWLLGPFLILSCLAPP